MNKTLQQNPGGTYYMYFSKKILEEVFQWDSQRPIKVDYDVANKRIIISEADGDDGNDQQQQ